jgi:hypothetical protein
MVTRLPPVPAVTSDLDAYRRDGEAFVSALTEAYYRNEAGHTTELPVAELYERNAHLFTREAAAELREAARTARDDAARGLRSLAEFAANGYLELATRTQTEAVTRREAEATAAVDGEQVPYRRLAALLANEPDRDRRERLEPRGSTRSSGSSRRS